MVVKSALPPKPKAAKAAPDPEFRRALPGMAYRVRPISPNPFGEIDPATYSDDLDAMLALAAELGDGAILESHNGSAYVFYAPMPPLMVADLVREGLAREVVTVSFGRDGKRKESRSYQLEPEGERRLRENQRERAQWRPDAPRS